MESGCFEVDTGFLRQNAGSLRQDLKSVQALFDDLTEMMATVSGMWEGPAKDAFYLQFSDDRTAFTQVCRQLDEIIESMEHAAKEYDACDDKVRSIVEAISV